MPIDRSEIEKKVKIIILDQLCGVIDPDEVDDTSKTLRSIGADSYDQVEIVVALEETFDILITDEQEDNIRTVQDAVDLVDRMVNS